MKIATRKLYSQNGSYVMVLPRKWMKRLSIEFGDKVALALRDGEVVVVLPKK